MKNYLVIWKTWLEDDIETPWDFTLVEKTNDFRLRENTSEIASKTEVESLFMSLDPDEITEFLAKYVDAFVLAAVVQLEDPAFVFSEISKCFKDAEIVKFIEVPDHLVNTVIDQIKSPAEAGLS